METKGFVSRGVTFMVRSGLGQRPMGKKSELARVRSRLQALRKKELLSQRERELQSKLMMMAIRLTAGQG